MRAAWAVRRHPLRGAERCELVVGVVWVARVGRVCGMATRSGDCAAAGRCSILHARVTGDFERSACDGGDPLPCLFLCARAAVDGFSRVRFPRRRGGCPPCHAAWWPDWRRVGARGVLAAHPGGAHGCGGGGPQCPRVLDRAEREAAREGLCDVRAHLRARAPVPPARDRRGLHQAAVRAQGRVIAIVGL